MTTLTLTETERIVLTGVLLKHISKLNDELDVDSGLSAEAKTWLKGIRQHLRTIKQKLEPIE